MALQCKRQMFSASGLQYVSCEVGDWKVCLWRDKAKHKCMKLAKLLLIATHIISSLHRRLLFAKFPIGSRSKQRWWLHKDCIPPRPLPSLPPTPPPPPELVRNQEELLVKNLLRYTLEQNSWPGGQFRASYLKAPTLLNAMVAYFCCGIIRCITQTSMLVIDIPGNLDFQRGFEVWMC